MDSLKKIKLLSNRGHAYLDYVVVATLLIAPEALALEGSAETFAYVLAAVHLGVTLATGFSLSLFNWLSVEAHKVIELLVGLSLILMSLVGTFDSEIAQTFYASIGVIILLVWALTNYSEEA